MICPKCHRRLVEITQPIRMYGKKTSQRTLLACAACWRVVRMMRWPGEYAVPNRRDRVKVRAALRARKP